MGVTPGGATAPPPDALLYMVLKGSGWVLPGAVAPAGVTPLFLDALIYKYLHIRRIAVIGGQKKSKIARLERNATARTLERKKAQEEPKHQKHQGPKRHKLL